MSQPVTTLQTPQPLIHRSMKPTNRHVEMFLGNIADGSMILDPPYQRGSVWTESQRIALVRSWMLGIPTGNITINDRTAPDSEWPRGGDVMWAVIDGKQRLLTAQAWFGGQLAVPASWWQPDHVAAAVDDVYRVGDGFYVTYAGLTRVAQRWCKNHFDFATCEAQLLTEAAEAEVYLLINGGGTPQTDLDMLRAASVAGR